MSKYIIQKGDTLSGIAAANNTTVDELARINNIADPNMIYAGNELILREGDSTGGDKVQYSSTGTGSSSASGAASGSGNATGGNAAGNASGGTASGIDYTFEASDTVNAANAALEAHMATRPGYTDKWGDQISSIIEQITNRDKFTYDVNSDALYQQYKDQYMALGKLASQDTMGQAAAMTGGYGSSYASTAGNQAYQSYLSQLNAVVPELYGMARDQYNQEGQDLYNQYGLLVDQENQDYSRYMDSYNQWASETDYLTGRADTLYGREYSEWADKIANQQWDQSFSYQQERDAVPDSQWQQSHQLDVNADQRAAEAWQMESAAAADSHKSYSGTTADGISYNNGGLTDGQVKELQAALGVDADGKYGPESQEAADGLSAEEAYNKYVLGESGETPPSYITDYKDIQGWSDGIINAETEKEALRYVERLEQVDPALADSLYEQWLKDHGLLPDIVDTTVGGGGGVGGVHVGKPINSYNTVK